MPVIGEVWGASQFLSNRSVPKEPSKIARHFNAGTGWENPSPAGTAEKNRLRQGCDAVNVFSGVPAGLVVIPSYPGVQTPGYFQNVPLGQSVSVV
jgi:hypothetical protein